MVITLKWLCDWGIISGPLYKDHWMYQCQCKHYIWWHYSIGCNWETKPSYFNIQRRLKYMNGEHIKLCSHTTLSVVWLMYAWPVPGWVVQGGQLSIEAFCMTMPSVSPTHAYISWQCGIHHSRVGPNRSGTHGLDHMLIVKTGWDILVICRYITWDGRHVIYW